MPVFRFLQLRGGEAELSHQSFSAAHYVYGKPSPHTVRGRRTEDRGRACPFRFAVPGESFGLTLFLRFSDRCRNPAMPSSATGSGIARFRETAQTAWERNALQFVCVQQDGHGAVVFRVDHHLGREDAGLDLKAALAALPDHLFIKRYGGFRPCGQGKARPA